MTSGSRFLWRLLAGVIVVADLLFVVPMYILATPLTQGCSIRAHCSTSTFVEILLIVGLVVVAIVPLIAARLAWRN